MQARTTIKYIIHLLFWVFFIIVLFVFASSYSEDQSLSWYDKIELDQLSLMLGITYLNDLLLLPYFFKRKYYFIYALLILALLFLVTYIYCHYMVGCGNDLSACFSYNLWIIALPMVFLSFIWLVLQFFDKQKELEEAHSDRLKMELKFLKAQINPHVLFNSLNTIYAQAIKENDSIAELILMLSENLKYVLDQSNNTFVDLEKDITFIENYLEFQELRTQNINNIIYTKEIDSYNHSIAPLILIDLIENAFKYSVYKEDQSSDIFIHIKSQKGKLHFVCKNEYDIHAQHGETDSGKIGLSNLKNRLNILYKDNFMLDINKTNGVFSVDLKINLG